MLLWPETSIFPHCLTRGRQGVGWTPASVAPGPEWRSQYCGDAGKVVRLYVCMCAECFNGSRAVGTRSSGGRLHEEQSTRVVRGDGWSGGGSTRKAGVGAPSGDRVESLVRDGEAGFVSGWPGLRSWGPDTGWPRGADLQGVASARETCASQGCCRDGCGESSSSLRARPPVSDLTPTPHAAVAKLRREGRSQERTTDHQWSRRSSSPPRRIGSLGVGSAKTTRPLHGSCRGPPSRFTPVPFPVS
jgi:hypothetical protein